MTCVEDDKVHGVILVIGGSTYGWLITHHESPLNFHYICDNGYLVEYATRKYGVKQRLIIFYTSDKTTVPLVFYEYILKTNLLQQT